MEAAEGFAAGDDRECAAALGARDSLALKVLLREWGGAYRFGVFDDGTWWWERRDGEGGRETADGPDAVYRGVTADHAFRPVRLEAVT